MVLFDGESVRVRSGTCDGFACALNFQYKQLVTLVQFECYEQTKKGKIGGKSMLCSEQNI